MQVQSSHIFCDPELESCSESNENRSPVLGQELSEDKDEDEEKNFGEDDLEDGRGAGVEEGAGAVHGLGLGRSVDNGRDHRLEL